jgi:hypothetical protein
LHGFAGFDEGGEVENPVEGSVFTGGSAEKALNAGTIGDIALDEFDTERDHGAFGMAKVIHDDNLMAAFHEQFRNGTADVSCSACNHDLHKKV